MLNHFLAVGGNEIVNSARAYGYAQSADCPAQWLEDPECDTIADVQGDPQYVIENVADAPWFDADDPDTSARFYGAYGIEMLGLSDSTRTAVITQKNGDGAVVSGYRHGPREVRVRTWLSAMGMDALEVGNTWLRNALEANACGQHGGACGESDSAFFVDCPPPRRIVWSYTDWVAQAVNLATNPSFEATSGTVEVRRNLSPNPALGTSTTTGWSAGVGNTGSVVTFARVSTGGPPEGAPGQGKQTWSTADSATGTAATFNVAGAGSSSADALAVSAATAYTASVWFRSSMVETVRLTIVEYDSGGVATTTNGTSVAVAALAWTRLSVSVATLASTVKMKVMVTQGATALHPVSTTWDVSSGLIEATSAVLPYFDGATAPRLRVQRITNPRLGSASTGWSSTGTFEGTAGAIRTSAAVAPGIDFMWRGWQVAASASNQNIRYGSTSALVIGRTYRAGFWARLGSAGAGNAFARVSTSTTLSDSYGASTPVPRDGQWHWYGWTFTATAAAFYGGMILATSSTDSDMSISGMYLEEVAVGTAAPTASDYFDGATVSDDFTYAWAGSPDATVSYEMDDEVTAGWTGTAHLSPSTLTAPGVVTAASGVYSPAYSSMRWENSGSRSLRVTPNGGSNDTYASVGGDVGGMRLGMEAGKTYTIIATMHLEHPQVGIVNAVARAIRPMYRIGAGSYVTLASPNQPNVAGDVTIHHTFTLPAGTTEAFIRLQNGSLTPGDDMWWDDMALIEGEYTGDYFDGRTATDTNTDPGPLYRYTWTGGIDASTSTWETRNAALAPEEDDTYLPFIDPYRRFLHSVRCISGPFTVQEASSELVPGLVGRLVEFTLLAEVPWVYGLPKELVVPPIIPTVVQDIAYNLAPYPSAELPGAAVVAATNWSTNPSVETNATGWSTTVGSPIVAGNVTSGRITGELAAVGTASYRAVFTAPGAASGGYVANQQEVVLGGGAGARYSVNIWSAAVIMAGTPAMTPIEVRAIWESSSGGTVLRTDLLGTIPLAGGPLSAKSLQPPAGATHVIIQARLPFTSYASGNIVRLYSDALAVTTP